MCQTTCKAFADSANLYLLRATPPHQPLLQASWGVLQNPVQTGLRALRALRPTQQLAPVFISDSSPRHYTTVWDGVFQFCTCCHMDMALI